MLLKSINFFVMGMVMIGCGRAPLTPFNENPGLPIVNLDYQGGDPLETPDPNNPRPTTPFCQIDSAGNYDREIRISKGESPDYYWAKGGACLHSSLEKVWASARNPENTVWEQVAEHAVTQLARNEADSIFEHYNILYVVRKFGFTIDWTMEWYHVLKKGSEELPEQVLVNYKRTLGTSHIPYWEGSIVLTRLTTDTSALYMVDQMRASRTSPDDCEKSVRRWIEVLQ